MYNVLPPVLYFKTDKPKLTSNSWSCLALLNVGITNKYYHDHLVSTVLLLSMLMECYLAALCSLKMAEWVGIELEVPSLG